MRFRPFNDLTMRVLSLQPAPSRMRPRLLDLLLASAVIALMANSSVAADDVTGFSNGNVTIEPDGSEGTIAEVTFGPVTIRVGQEDDTESQETRSSPDDDRERLDERLQKDVHQTVQQAGDGLERLVHGLEPLLTPDDDDAATEDAPTDDDAALAPASTQVVVTEPETPAGLLVAGAVAATVGIAAVTKHSIFSRIGATLLAPLFSRFEGPSVLKHPRRQELHHLVCRTPGTTAPELCEATGLSRNAVLHHLRMLADQNLLVAKRMGRATHWFENGGRYGREHKAAYAVLRDGRSRDVASFVLQNPGTTQGQVSQALGLAPSVIHWHMRRLEEAALVERRKQGRTMQCFPGDPLPSLGL